MPRKRPVTTLRKQALFNVKKLIFDCAKNMVKFIGIIGMMDPQLTNTKMQSMVQQVKEFVNSIIPQDVMTEISLMCFMEIKYDNKCYVYNCVYNYNHIIIILAEAIFNARELRTIPFGHYPLFAQYVLFRHLSCMYKLQVLNMNSTIIWAFPHFEQILITGLCNMSNLEEFTLYRYCTDNIIAAIASKCKIIRKIDVFFSKRVTSACISNLLLCTELRDIRLLHTCVDRFGYRKLSVEHPNLENVDYVYLSTMFISSDNMSKYTKIKNVGCVREGYFKPNVIYVDDNDATKINIEDLLQLINIHPNIIRLYIDCRTGNEILKILSYFPNVKDVLIESYNCNATYSNALHDGLICKGFMLRSLCFVNGIFNLNSLIDISQFCPNIESLSFYRFEFLTNYSEINKFFSENSEVTSFQLVERLEMSDGTSDETSNFVKFLCSYCINVKSIYIRGIGFITDEMMEDIFSFNPMKQLEVLIITGCVNDLTISTVEILMKHCDNLRYLPNIKNWSMDTEELKILKNSLKLNNIELDISDHNECPDQYTQMNICCNIKTKIKTLERLSSLF